MQTITNKKIGIRAFIFVVVIFLVGGEANKQQKSKTTESCQRMCSRKDLFRFAGNKLFCHQQIFQFSTLPPPLSSPLSTRSEIDLS